MKKIYKILIAFSLLIVILAVTAPQHEFPFDMKINGDLTIDSVLMLTTTPAVSTSDTALVYDDGVVKYSLTASDSSLWEMDTDTTYSKNSGNVRITAGDLYSSADGTYDLGTSNYGWDTLFLSSVIEYGSNLVFSYGGTKAVLTTAGHLGVGDNSPDSAISTTGGEFTTDILVGGGYKTWAPTLSWTGGTPSAPTKVGRYSIVNNTVEFTVTLIGNNDSGNTLTAITILLPYTPKDINAYPIVAAGISQTTGDFSTQLLYLASYIDALDNADGNRKIYAGTFSILNSADYLLSFTGTYEITTK